MAGRKKSKGPAAIEPPALPPKTAEEQADSLQYAEFFYQLAAEQRARNLASCVLLAQQAACGHGPLVEHFAELGRRYSHLLTPTPSRTRKTLRVIPGGRD